MHKIILDFLSYNNRMVRDFSGLLRRLLLPRDLKLIHRVAAQAHLNLMPLYMVGGAPRDLALGRPARDFDLVVEGDAIVLARALAAKFGGKVTVHPRFRTAKWAYEDASSRRTGFKHDSRPSQDGRSVDLISARKEMYPGPAELPRVEPSNIQDDLQRRDFTINALAVRLDDGHFGELYDPWGALGDIRAGRVRVLHAASFSDDPTRIYRAIRYEQRYGFRIEPRTLRSIQEARNLVTRLSAQRIRRELDLILDEDCASSMVRRMRTLDLLGPIHLALPADLGTARRLESAEAAERWDGHSPSRRNRRWLLWLMKLSSHDIVSLNRRLHFERSLLVSLLAAPKLRGEVPALTRQRPSEIAARLRRFPLPAIEAYYHGAAKGASRRILEDYLARWRHVRPTTTGSRLRELGVPPGPIYQRILGNLRDAWLDGLVRTRKEERARLDELLQHLGH